MFGHTFNFFSDVSRIKCSHRPVYFFIWDYQSTCICMLVILIITWTVSWPRTSTFWNFHLATNQNLWIMYGAWLYPTQLNKRRVLPWQIGGWMLRVRSRTQTRGCMYAYANIIIFFIRMKSHILRCWLFNNLISCDTKFLGHFIIVRGSLSCFIV